MLWGKEMWRVQEVMNAIVRTRETSLDAQNGTGFTEDNIGAYDPLNGNDSVKIYDLLDYLHDSMNEFNHFDFWDYNAAILVDLGIEEQIDERREHLDNSVIDFIEDRIPEFFPIPYNQVVNNIRRWDHPVSKIHVFTAYLNNVHGPTEDGTTFYEKAGV